MTKIQKLFKFCKEVNNDSSHFLRRQYGVVSAGVGDKKIKGKSIGKTSIILNVVKKKSKNKLSPEEIIPGNLEIDGVNIITDIVNIEDVKTISAYCHLQDSGIDPVKQHYHKHRPLKGGISSINGGFSPFTNWGEFFSDATLGIFVRDKRDGQIVALSNNHVYNHSMMMPSVWNKADEFYVGAMNLGNRNTQNNVLTRGAVQPTRYTKDSDSTITTWEWEWQLGIRNHFGYSQSSAYHGSDPKNIITKELTGCDDFIGNCKRATLFGDKAPWISFDSYNYPESYVDAAILQLDNYDLIDSVESNQILNFNEPGPYSFASEEEIYSLFDDTSLNYGAPIFRAGRTLGPLGIEGSEIGDCTNTGTGRMSATAYNSANVTTTTSYNPYFFPENIIVEGDGSMHVAQGGDSGTAVFAQLSSSVPSASAWKLIGLLYAGPSDLSKIIISPIHLIQVRLNIVSWDGTMPQLSSTTETLTTYDADIFVSGKNAFCMKAKRTYKGQEYSMSRWIHGNPSTFENQWINDMLPNVESAGHVPGSNVESNNSDLLSIQMIGYRDVDSGDKYNEPLRQYNSDNRGFNVNIAALMNNKNEGITSNKILKTPFLTGGMKLRTDILNLQSAEDQYLFNDSQFDSENERPWFYKQMLKDGVFDTLPGTQNLNSTQSRIFDDYKFVDPLIYEWVNDRVPSRLRMQDLDNNGKPVVSKANYDKLSEWLFNEYQKLEKPVNALDHYQDIIGTHNLLNNNDSDKWEASREQGTHAVKFANNGDMFNLITRGYPYTAMMKTIFPSFSSIYTGTFQTIYTSPTGSARNYGIVYERIFDVHSGSLIYDKQPLGRHNQSKIVVFDSKGNIKQTLTPFSRLNDPTHPSPDVLKYKTVNNEVVSFTENNNYWGYASSSLLGSFDDKSSGIQVYGDYLFVYVRAQDGRSSDYNRHDGKIVEKYDIYKLNRDTDLWEPHQALNGQWNFDHVVDNSKYAGIKGFNRTFKTHVYSSAVNDRYLATNSPNAGIQDTGSLNLYEIGEDGFYTESLQLSTPFTLDSFNDSSYVGELGVGVARFGSKPVWLGDYLFYICEINSEISNTLGLSISTSQTSDIYTYLGEIVNPEVFDTKVAHCILDSSSNFTLTNIMSGLEGFDIINTANKNDIFVVSDHLNYYSLLRRSGNCHDKIIMCRGLLKYTYNFNAGEGPGNWPGGSETEYLNWLYFDFMSTPITVLYDLVEIVGNTPSITKRLSTNHYPADGFFYEIGYNTEFKESILGNAYPRQMHHDSNYLYSYNLIPLNAKYTDNITFSGTQDDRALFPTFNKIPEILRYSFEDETYFKPISAYGFDGPVPLNNNRGITRSAISTNNIGVARSNYEEWAGNRLTIFNPETASDFNNSSYYRIKT